MSVISIESDPIDPARSRSSPCARLHSPGSHGPRRPSRQCYDTRTDPQTPGLAGAPVAGTVVYGDSGVAAGDAQGLAEGTPGEAAPSVFRHLATRVVGIPARVAVHRTHRMRAGTVRAIGVDGASAPAAGPGAVATGIVAVAASEARATGEHNINRYLTLLILRFGVESTS